VLGRIEQRVDAAPTLAAGEDVVVFLRRSAEGVGEGAAGTFGVTALAQGKFTVVGRTARPDLSKVSFVRTSVPGGERRAEEMPLDELERRVRRSR
jgi:hypothetical protein